MFVFWVEKMLHNFTQSKLFVFAIIIQNPNDNERKQKAFDSKWEIIDEGFLKTKYPSGHIWIEFSLKSVAETVSHNVIMYQCARLCNTFCKLWSFSDKLFFIPATLPLHYWRLSTQVKCISQIWRICVCGAQRQIFIKMHALLSRGNAKCVKSEAISTKKRK